jgi:hypothetical protein
VSEQAALPASGPKPGPLGPGSEEGGLLQRPPCSLLLFSTVLPCECYLWGNFLNVIKLILDTFYQCQLAIKQDFTSNMSREEFIQEKIKSFFL